MRSLRRYQRYHIQLKNHRTTVSLDKIISDMMAIKLGEIPGTKQAHRVVRQQLEEFSSPDSDKDSTSYILCKIKTESILFITDKIISDKYWEWWDKREDNNLL